ncbi:MAG TPA: hypothetical protein VLC09_15960, partial [Polyangiaceae bacterium]|nr:hypothetical protein [Polyangiaceae bacterium]
MAYVKFGRFVLGALVSSWLVAACGDAGGTGQPDSGEGSGGTPSGDGPGPDDGSTGGSGPIAGAPGTGGETPVGPTQLSAIHQEGAFWVNEEGEKVRLRGANLGNWLILEFWMMAQAMNDG